MNLQWMRGKPFEKGDERINRTGRKPGIPNRTPEAIRRSFLLLLSDNLNQLRQDIKGLAPQQRVSLLIQLSKLILPPPLMPDKLSEEQIHEMIEYIKNYDDEN